jgi:hypothetical protein
MANNIEKLLGALSKLASIQQVSDNQYPQNTQVPLNTNAAPNSGDQAKYIYITMEDLTAIFPGIADKLDITKLLSGLKDKSVISKILSQLGVISVTPMDSSEQNKNTSSK